MNAAGAKKPTSPKYMNGGSGGAEEQQRRAFLVRLWTKEDRLLKDLEKVQIFINNGGK